MAAGLLAFWDSETASAAKARGSSCTAASATGTPVVSTGPRQLPFTTVALVDCVPGPAVNAEFKQSIKSAKLEEGPDARSGGGAKTASNGVALTVDSATNAVHVERARRKHRYFDAAASCES
jgi:hypothetical protein